MWGISEMRVFLLIGIINGFLAVALGAFGTHGLEGKVSEDMLDIWDKAVNYQMFHTMAIMITAILLSTIKSKSIISAGWLFITGIILFSGSLYMYSTTGMKWLAMITPIGGVVFLAGWAILGYAVVKWVGAKS